VNVKESLSLTYPVRKTLAITLNNPARSAAAPSLPKKSCKPTTVAMGLRVPATPSHTTDVAIAPSSLTIPTPVTPPCEPAISTTDQLSRERVSLGVTTDVLRSVPMQPKKKPKSEKPREGRTCRRCGIRACPGKKSVNSCKNPCRDCGKMDCPGRNPKRPKRTCNTAWIGVNVGD
jgi:hypothetical protein